MTRTLIGVPQKKNGCFLLFFIGKEEHIIFHFDKIRTDARTTVGITGLGAGTGVTHLAVSLCSYCASKLGKRTAYAELHARNEIASVCPKTEHSSEPEPAASHFQLHGTDYYPGVDGRLIPTLLNQGYDYLIFDSGNFAETDLSEFLRCDRKLILGSLAPWKSGKIREFFDLLESNDIYLGESLYYLMQTGSRKDLLYFSKSCHIPIQYVQPVPFIKDPFCIEKEQFPFLQKLLTG